MLLFTATVSRAGRPLTHARSVPTLRIADHRLLLRVKVASRQQSSSTSIHQPLNHANNEIRLILIAPGQKGDRIACRLEVVSLNRLPKYDTLSYTWGNPKLSSQILVNNSPVSITASLYNALHSIRHPKKTVTLWADGLCIDQSNNAEKSKQVAMMNRIYHHGRQTWISLGSPDEDWANGTWSPPSKIDESFSTARYILRYFWSVCWHNIMWRRSRKSRLGAGHLNDARRQLKILEIKGDPSPQEKHDRRMTESMLNWLLTNEYWRRVWILQEVVLSEKDPICLFGIHQIPLLSLDTVLGALVETRGSDTSTPDYLRVGFKRAMEVCLLRDETTLTRYFGLIRCLYFSSHRNATQAVDHVWGVRGILSKEDQKLLPPDFSMSTSDLYAKVTKVLLHKTRSADMLCASAGVDGNNKHGLPSWALNMSEPLELPASVSDEGTVDFSLPADNTDLRVLSVEGRKMHEHIIAVRDPHVDLMDTVHKLRSTLDVASDTLEAQKEPESSTEQITHYTPENSRIQAVLDRSVQKTASQFLGVDLPHGFGQDGTKLFWGMIKAPVYERLVHRNQLYADDHEFECGDSIFYTASGRIGKCLHSVEVGDELWMLPGSSTVFVLRPVEESGDSISRYRFVGPCVCTHTMLGLDADGEVENTTMAHRIELV